MRTDDSVLVLVVAASRADQPSQTLLLSNAHMSSGIACATR